MAFEAKNEYVYNLLGRNRYYIPRNQRHYVWEQKNLSNLLDDLCFAIDTNSEHHFFGSFVLEFIGRNNDISEYLIVDGQQRIISLTIMLSTILYIFKNNGRMKEFEGAKDYLQSQNSFGDYLTVIDSEHHESLEKIIKYILDEKCDIKFNILLSINTINKIKDRKILDAYVFFYESLSKILNDKGMDYLKKIREAITSITYVSIITSDEENSYTIFEILNARGIPLDDHELLKNYIMRYYLPQNNRDKVKEIWYEIEQNVENMKYYLLHYTEHKFKYSPSIAKTRSCYNIIQENTENKNVVDLLNDLRVKSYYYNKICRPNNDVRSEVEKVENKVFSVFKKRRYVQMRPLLISLMHKHEEGLIEDSTYIDTLEYICLFFICYKIIAEEHSNKLTNIVNHYAFQIENNFNETLIKKLASELKSKMPSKQAFINKFKQLGYSNHSSFYKDNKYKERVHLVLEEFEKYKNGGYCRENFTIEHIKNDCEGQEENALIGNLIPLEEKINNTLGDVSYEEKIETYKMSDYKSTRLFAKRYEKQNFDPENRAKHMAEEFYDNILKLSN